MASRVIASRAIRPAPRPTRATPLDRLRAKIGADDFYRDVAKLDPKNGARWLTMLSVQKRFKEAEPSYRNPAARTYSESNRDTLHRLTIELLANRRPGQDVYRDFIELHPTLFKENGACELPLKDQLIVLSHTDPEMFLSPQHKWLLSTGLVADEKWIALVRAAADETRAARRAQGLPATVSGYR